MRNFGVLVALLLIYCVALFYASAAPQRAQAKRPNFVLFISDDFSWHDSGAYGARDVQTPHLDQLAHEGIVFDQAFAASPTCTPSRSAIYSGLYPFRNGAHANHSIVRDGVQTLPHYLKALGYRVVLAGKTHIGARENFPFEYLENSNVMPPGKDHVLWTDLNTDAVERLLANHDREQPLCLVVCSHSPHVYWLENQNYDAAKLNLPPYLLDTPETRVARTSYYTDVSHMDVQVGAVRRSLGKHGYAGNTLFIYTADQGAQFPFAKWNLYDAGIRAPLIAQWSGKISPGTRSSALISLVDLLPTMIEIGGGRAPKDLDGRSFLSVLLGRKNSLHEEVYASHTGDGNMNRSPMRAVRTARYKLINNLAPQNIYKTHIDGGVGADGRDYWESWERLAQTNPHAAEVVRRYHHRPAEELYDLIADPYEQRNLAADPAGRRVLNDLRRKLTKWRLQQGEDVSKVPMPEDARKGSVPYAK